MADFIRDLKSDNYNTKQSFKSSAEKAQDIVNKALINEIKAAKDAYTDIANAARKLKEEEGLILSQKKKLEDIEDKLYKLREKGSARTFDEQKMFEGLLESRDKERKLLVKRNEELAKTKNHLDEETKKADKINTLLKEKSELSKKVLENVLNEKEQARATMEVRLESFKKEQDEAKKRVSELKELRDLKIKEAKDEGKSQKEIAKIKKDFNDLISKESATVVENRKNELSARRSIATVENRNLTTLEKQKKLQDLQKQLEKDKLEIKKDLEKREAAGLINEQEKNKELEKRNKLLEEGYEADTEGLSDKPKLGNFLKESATKYTEEQGINSNLAGLLTSFKGDAGEMISSVLGKAAGPVGVIVSILGKLLSGVMKIGSDIAKGVEIAANIRTQYYSPINTRLQGITEYLDTEQEGDYFSTIVDRVNDILGDTSGLAKQTDIVKNIATLTSKGIAFNIEERAIIETLKDKLVTTFDATNENLLRLIRLQQTDMTASQAGTESKLTQFFNQRYQDSSYMTDQYTNVLGTISEAMNIMNVEEATAFNYNVQKWLGSLYSLGMSGQGVQTLAQGINAIATGDLKTFESNDSLRTLFAAASQGSYGDLLNYGLNASNVDELMQNILSYLSQIAGDTTLVTKQARASVFGGLSLSDIKSISNLNQENDIESIVTSNISSIEARNRIFNDIKTMSTNNRISLAEVYENILDNLKYSFGEEVMNSDYDIDSLGIGRRVLRKLDLEDYIGENTALNGYALWQVLGQMGSLGQQAQSLWALSYAAGMNENDVTENFKYKLSYGAGSGRGEQKTKSFNSYEEAQNYIDEHNIKDAHISQESYLTANPGSKSRLESALADIIGSSFGMSVGRNFNYDLNRIENLPVTFRGANGEIIPIGLTTGITSSGSLNYGNYSYSGGVSGVSSYASDISSTAATISSQSTSDKSYTEFTKSLEYTAMDIYTELFEFQRHPIRVKLSSLEDESLNQLFIKAIKDNINDIRNTVVDGSVRADIIDNDINSIVNNIYRIRTSSSW